ncbi:zinc finger protein 862-like [Argopecten irradians]|uniref:zinc finger protein 862-like n=1 Tax=Argopecten irradians TaxID=31199 RepID=UPI003712DFCD
MLDCISAQIRKPILTMIRDSLYFSILIDETTDIAVLKQMTVMARFMTPEMKVRTAFLGLVDLPDGKADTIMAALETFFRENELPLNKLIGMGSDGASVMVGRKTGVATQLKTVNPELINIHCVAHRLALASAQATDNIPYLRKFKDIMQQLFRFYQNSAVRMSGLKEIEEIGNN